MFKHVLVPLDGSPLAEAAVDAARGLMQPGTRITLLTVVQKPKIPIYGYQVAVSLTPSFPHRVGHAMAEAKAYLATVATTLRKAGFKVDQKASFGINPAHVIVKTARQSGVDAIVMSTHGRSGMNRLLRGSVTGKVLTSAGCPVMVIQGGEEHTRDDGTPAITEPESQPA